MSAELHAIHELHEDLRRFKGEIMAAIDDLNAAVASVQGDVSALQTIITQIDADVEKAIADIQATSGTGLQPSIDSLKTIHTNLQALAASLSAEDKSLETAENPPAPTPAPAPAPTVEPAPTPAS